MRGADVKRLLRETVLRPEYVDWTKSALPLLTSPRSRTGGSAARRFLRKDRDWYREQPSAAWKNRWSGRSEGWRDSLNEPVEESWEPLYSRSSARGSGRLHPGGLSAIAVSALFTAVLWRFDVHHLLRPASAPPGRVQPTSLPAARVSPPAANVVRLPPQPGLDTPATAVATWSVTGPRFGTVSVVVPIGTTPRDALAIAFAERGFQLVG